MSTGAGIITDPDTEVLDFERALLVDLCFVTFWLVALLYPDFFLRIAYHVQAHDLAIGLLDLLQLCEEVPESGFSDHSVSCEYAHAIQLWSRVGIGGQVTPDHLVFLKAT